MNAKIPGKATELPCPVCETRLVAYPCSRQEALAWCEACGWNLAGSGKVLRTKNLSLFLRTFLFLPVLAPLALIFHAHEPVLAYGLDLMLVLALFMPALIRSQANLALARKIEGFQPVGRTVAHAGWSLESPLAQPTPRPTQLRGTTIPVKGLLKTLRALWTVVFISGLLALTPAAHVIGPRAQFGALMLLGFAIAPIFGTLIALFVVMLRDRHLAKAGRPCEGRIIFQMTHLRRLGRGEWTLASRYRYRFSDPHGTEREGHGQEEGRAIVMGSKLTILDSPRDPRVHGSYLAGLYS